MLYFHQTLFLKDERRRQILHDIPVIVLEPIEDSLLVTGVQRKVTEF